MSTFNTDLIDDLAREKVVLFLGAGVSSSAITARGGRIAGWTSFLNTMCTHAGEPISSQARKLIEKSDYLLACEILQGALADRWADYVAEEFGQRAVPSSLHLSILRLRQRLILTTNFDKLLEAADSSDTHFSTVISTMDDSVFRSLKDHSKKYIIKIHGTIDNMSSLVFSRSEYIRLAFGNSNYSGFLENLLLNYTFLFVGFSMEDPAIISLMEMYALRYKSSRPHYMVTSSIIEPNVAEIFKRLRKLNFIHYAPDDNHTSLPPLIEKLANEAIRRRREIYAETMR